MLCSVCEYTIECCDSVIKKVDLDEDVNAQRLWQCLLMWRTCLPCAIFDCVLFLGIGLWEGCRCTRKETHSHNNPRSWTVTIWIAEPCLGICIHVVTVLTWQGLEEVCVGRPALEKQYNTQNVRYKREQKSYTIGSGSKKAKERWLTAYSLLKSVTGQVNNKWVSKSQCEEKP